jgi:anti-sigma factor RsiW
MSKGCPEFAVALSAYFDRELEGQERQAMESHLEQCEPCRISLQKLERIRAAMTQLARRPGGNKSILDAIRSRLEEAPAPRKKAKPVVS